MTKRTPRTTYKPGISQSLLDYVDETLGKKRLPFIQEFCRKNQIPRRTFYNWLKATDEDKNKLHPELNDAYDELMSMQEMMLIELGVSGKAGIAMCIFLLKTKHGHIETEKIQHVGDVEEPLTLIFTDVATFKAHEANKAKREQEESRKRLEVQKTKEPEDVGGYDWSDYSKNPLTT